MSAGEGRGIAGKVALVTGAASGIGRAVAFELAGRGASVVVSDVSPAINVVADELQERGCAATAVIADVAEEEAAARLVDEAVRIFGGLDLVHNNAGTTAATELADTSLADFERVIRVNLTGVFLAMKYQIPALLSRGGGAIVNTASMWAFTGAPGKSAYVASKHGVVGLTRAASIEYGPKNVRINAIAPGPIDSGMTAAVPSERLQSIVGRTSIGRIGTPEEVARAVAWLLSEEASYVQGSTLTVDGGWGAS